MKNFAKKWAPRLEFNQNLMVDIIDDTVAFYSFDVTRRATDVNVPQLYVTEDGRRSAVGRYMTNPVYGLQGRVWFLSDIQGNSAVLSQYLREHVKHLSIIFWSDLQLLHDVTEKWGVNGLSDAGKNHVTWMRSKLNAGEYDVYR